MASALSTQTFGSIRTLRAQAPAPVRTTQMITVGKSDMQVRCNRGGRGRVLSE
jgi:hypothetical protein